MLRHLFVAALMCICYLFTDIKFKVDDGIVLAHKSLLMARCEMMYAMFNDNFIEASADVVSNF